ncbi:MAG: AraC family transcriptional regulator [Candidatus Rokuibacteriota bacterium]|nr:MAG: AraC family transcriptional regulator [Candidatus Rokubacteria bacterium]
MWPCEPGARWRDARRAATSCGFNDVSHFGRMFAARMHMTPSRWRRRRP